MELKDYYQLLELPPSATLPEIKKAYRRLALLYHPDKNNNDPYSAALFAEIKEAYEVLTSPSKKEAYLQQRWYNQSAGRRRTQAIITPVTVLKQALELERYVSKLDVFRMDKAGLHEYISGLIADTTVEKLNTFNDTQANDEIIKVLLACLQPLPLPFVLSLQPQLNKIRANPASYEKISAYVTARQKMHKRENYKIWIILFLVIATCLLIYFLGE